MRFLGMGSDAPKEGSGFVVGYVLRSKAFHEARQLTGKKRDAWNYPTNLVSLISDPSPLILRERWYFDAESVEEALLWIERHGPEDPTPLAKLFRTRSIFEKKVFEGWLIKEEDSSELANFVRELQKTDLEDAISELKRVYGSSYGYPDNLRFETFNAAVLKLVGTRYPELTLLDDALRAPVYRLLGIMPYSDQDKRAQALKKVVNAARPRVVADDLEHRLLPVPSFPGGTTPKQFADIHQSKGAQQLRDMADTIVKERLPDSEISRFVQEARLLAASLSPGKDVVYALGEIAGAGFSAAASPLSPLFLIPAIGLGALGVHKLWGAFHDLASARSLKWVEVASKIAPLEKGSPVVPG